MIYVVYLTTSQVVLFRLMKIIEFNKLAAALLIAGTSIALPDNIAHWIYGSTNIEKSIKMQKDDQGDESIGPIAIKQKKEPFVIPSDLRDLIKKANVDQGAKLIKKCTMCHNITSGAGTKIGPDLWRIVDRKVASVETFNYSSAMKDFATKNPTWTNDMLYTYLHNPRILVPGTRMSFPGIAKQEDLIDLIAFLDTLT